jgi:hypothetical protein
MMAEVPYALLERARLLVESYGGLLLDEEFAAGVAFTARFRTAGYPAFAEALRELSHGAVEAVIVASDEATIMPVERM